jgi:hypothetical protein
MTESDKDAVWKFRHHLTREKKASKEWESSLITALIDLSGAHEIFEIRQLVGPTRSKTGHSIVAQMDIY